MNAEDYSGCFLKLIDSLHQAKCVSFSKHFRSKVLHREERREDPPATPKIGFGFSTVLLLSCSLPLDFRDVDPQHTKFRNNTFGTLYFYHVEKDEHKFRNFVKLVIAKSTCNICNLCNGYVNTGLCCLIKR